MISPSSYQLIYLIIVTVITLCVINVKRLPKQREIFLPSALLCLFMVIFIGFRPVDGVYFVDMANYHEYWIYQAQWEGFDFSSQNLIFDNLLNYMAAGSSMSETSFFVLMASLYFVGLYVACRKLFPNHTLLSFLVCLAAFSTFSYATNGIKAGVAASLFLVALAYRDRLWVSILFLLLSWGFHHSMQLPVAAYVLTIFFKRKEWYFYGWCFCLVLAIAHVSFFQNLFASMSDESGAGYLNNTENDWGGARGFRIDFVIYSAMPIVMGYYVKYVYKLKDELYDSMLNMYMTTNAVWMLCMYAEFTNRIAYLSWFMYPIVLIYPCLAINNMSHPLVKNRNTFVLCHLGFTLFMMLIYYR